MKPQRSRGIGPETVNICRSSMKMLSLNPDVKTGLDGMSICAQTWSKMVSVELWASFWRTNTKNRSINLATTTTIWMELKGERANRLSLPKQLEVQGDYRILPKQLKHHLASDPTTKYSQNNKYQHLWNHKDLVVSGLKLWIFVPAPWKCFHWIRTWKWV